MIPKNFNGAFKMQINAPAFKFLESSNNCESESFTVYFYRRETENYTIEEFLDSISPENIGWDEPTKQLFYKDIEGKTYKLKFEELK